MCSLQVKRNVKTESSRRCKASGSPRLGNSEFLPILLDFVEFSATLPNDNEFAVFWDSVLARMKADQVTTDFNEPRMATYLEENIFTINETGISSPWRSGLGTVPLGYSSYAPNAIESSHRVVKSLLDPGYAVRGIGTLMKDVCEGLATRLEKGDYSSLSSSIKEPWSELTFCRRKRLASAADQLGEPQKAQL